LRDCVDMAMAYSKRGGVLVERYMSCDDIFAYYTFKDGEVFLSAIADRITTKKQGGFSSVCLGALYPSKHTALFLEKAQPSLARMFKGLQVKDGVLNIQFFVEDGNFF